MEDARLAPHSGLGLSGEVVTYENLIEEISWFMHSAPKKRVRRMLTLFADAVIDECKSGGSVSIPGLGVFRRGTRKARRAKLRGQWVELPEVATVKFTAAKAAKEKLR